MTKKIAIALNSVELLKHALFKGYTFPKEASLLNLTQERILMTVKNSDELPMVTIARAIGLEKGPFSQTVDKLEKLNYIERVRSKEDKRLVYLKLTAEGETITKIIEDSMEEHFKVRMTMLSSSELHSFFQALEVLKNTANILISK
ncbi:MarR family winged helix-turn-helix transcriptional regulator [Sphingobacterium litopenaei]|jgi:DNA-binding MarR family transcriptional regulator|uniref:MarR family transcriptional regulator n=1 Tax=Sphingobacterium litopenaei TaxID=2763500 RepID=A0ABR7YGI4_9SPHI|nr:MarR family transcriptional regulator [Sphingobacterium litopenaei]MBD1430417.1 MarR family transcriptional regulator [Sphingobacterium litopenaei]